MTPREDCTHRALQYAVARGISLQNVGDPPWGADGYVFWTSRQSAVKVFKHERLHCRERDVYLRLQELGVSEVRAFAVPRLVEYDDRLWVVEMTIVRPPFVLDFAGAYLDFPPDYPEEIVSEWREAKSQQFEGRWPEVQRVMHEFAAMGIFLSDVKPGNIEFES